MFAEYVPKRTVEPALEPTIFVVDDDVSVRESLELLIREAGWRAETFGSAQAFLARAPVEAPRCLVLDMGLPGLSGLDVQERMAREQPYMPIIIVTGSGDVPMTIRAMKAGAFEFLTKPFAPDVLLDSMRNAVARSRSALREQAALRALQDCYASLTRREREVMERVTSGLLNKQVAAELGISVITVKAHRAAVMRKMMAASLPDLVTSFARIRGWVEPS